jgi:hypothetical protein
VSEVERLRLMRKSLAVACPWCSQPPGEDCRTPDNKRMGYPHERRSGAWMEAGKPELVKR